MNKKRAIKNYTRYHSIKISKVVPNEHLIGLESISIIDKFTLKKDKGAWGIYRPKYGLEKARIEIAVEYL